MLKKLYHDLLAFYPMKPWWPGDSALETAVGNIRERFGHFALQRACLVGYREFGAINPRDDHTIHPVGWHNG